MKVESVTVPLVPLQSIPPPLMFALLLLKVELLNLPLTPFHATAAPVLAIFSVNVESVNLPLALRQKMPPALMFALLLMKIESVKVPLSLPQ